MSTPHSAELRNWNLTSRCNLVSYLGHASSFVGGGLSPLQRMHSGYSKPCRQNKSHHLRKQVCLASSFFNITSHLIVVKKQESQELTNNSCIYYFCFQLFHWHLFSHRNRLASWVESNKHLFPAKRDVAWLIIHQAREVTLVMPLHVKKKSFFNANSQLLGSMCRQWWICILQEVVKIFLPSILSCKTGWHNGSIAHTMSVK